MFVFNVGIGIALLFEARKASTERSYWGLILGAFLFCLIGLFSLVESIDALS